MWDYLGQIQINAMNQKVKVERYLLCRGDADNINTWSNTPCFLLDSGLEAGCITSGVSLRPEQLKEERLIWNIIQLLPDRRPSDFNTRVFC